MEVVAGTDSTGVVTAVASQTEDGSLVLLETTATETEVILVCKFLRYFDSAVIEKWCW